MLTSKMKQHSLNVYLWSAAAILIAVSTATPTSFSGETGNSMAEPGYDSPERKFSKSQTQSNSINPEFNYKRKLKSIEYECGTIDDEGLQTPDAKYVCNFYNHIMKTNNDFTEIKDGLEKCYGFLCNWYKASCNYDENVKVYKDLKAIKEKQATCGCMIRFWQKYSCAKVFNTGDIAEEEDEKDFNGLVDEIKVTDENYESKKDSSEEFDMFRNKRATQDFITFSDNEETPAAKQSSFGDTVLQRFSTEERQCFATQKVLFRGECQSLSSKGPCGKDQWLVLQKPTGPVQSRDTTPRPTCKTKPCTAMDEVWWPASRRCIKKTLAKPMCQDDGMIVTVDVFGDGICKCENSYGVFENDSGCYAYYQQGPCEFGEVVTYDKTTGYSVCTKDKCATENSRPAERSKRSDRNDDGYLTSSNGHHVTHYRSTAIKKRFANDPEAASFVRDKRENLIDAVGLYDKDLIKIEPHYHNTEHANRASEGQERIRIRRQASEGFAYDTDKKLYAPMHGDGVCLKLNTEEPCVNVSSTSRFVINQDSHLPVCSVSLALHLIDGAPKCKTENNMCRDVVQIKQESDADFYLYMMNQIKTKRDTRRQG